MLGDLERRSKGVQSKWASRRVSIPDLSFYRRMAVRGAAMVANTRVYDGVRLLSVYNWILSFVSVIPFAPSHSLSFALTVDS